MPCYPCRWPTCTAYLKHRGYCSAHQDKKPLDNKAIVQARYDATKRDPEAKRFYDSAAWQRARREKLTRMPICERCRRVVAEHVHHSIPVKIATNEQRLDQSCLVSVCIPCHNAIEAHTAKNNSSR